MKSIQKPKTERKKRNGKSSLKREIGRIPSHHLSEPWAKGGSFRARCCMDGLRRETQLAKGRAHPSPAYRAGAQAAAQACDRAIYRSIHQSINQRISATPIEALGASIAVACNPSFSLSLYLSHNLACSVCWLIAWQVWGNWEGEGRWCGASLRWCQAERTQLALRSMRTESPPAVVHLPFHSASPFVVVVVFVVCSQKFPIAFVMEEIMAMAKFWFLLNNCWSCWIFWNYLHASVM